MIKRFEQYQVPVIELKKETPKEAVCLVFERVNTGGVPLTVFELLTAAFAADDFQLRDDWNAREARLKQQHPVLRNLQSDDFLQAISLLVTQSTAPLRARRWHTHRQGARYQLQAPGYLEARGRRLAGVGRSRRSRFRRRRAVPLRTEDLQVAGPALPHPARAVGCDLHRPRPGR